MSFCHNLTLSSFRYNGAFSLMVTNCIRFLSGIINPSAARFLEAHRKMCSWYYLQALIIFLNTLYSADVD